MNRQRRPSFVLLLTSLVLLVTLIGGTWNTAKATVIPTFSIVSVQVDQSVTITTHNFPANDTFNVLMNTMGTRGVGGVLVTSVNSGSGGSLTWTFAIPASLKGLSQIAIRLESPTSGFFAFNWFWNNTAGGIPNTGATPTATPASTLVTIPTFSIAAVVRDSTVTIQTANFPANDTFDVLMNVMGTRGVGGTRVDTVNSAGGGVLTFTFAIPAALHGQSQIAIRLESPTSGFFAFNWFWNTTTGSVPPTGATPTPAPGVTQTPAPTLATIPTITILSVVKDSTVTIQTNNFPANDNFIVLMNHIGTRGIGGIQVDSFNSGSGGSFIKTFTIPAALHGQSQIAIRLESPTSGFFAFNWFFNVTAPQG